MGEKKTNALSKSMKLIYVYAMATGAIFTFMCYWDGIFMSYTGPGTFLAFALMTLAVLPTAFVYAEFSTMLPSTGSCLVFNTVGINKHAGFWSAWLIMCAWIAVPAAGAFGVGRGSGGVGHDTAFNRQIVDIAFLKLVLDGVLIVTAGDGILHFFAVGVEAMDKVGLAVSFHGAVILDAEIHVSLVAGASRTVCLKGGSRRDQKRGKHREDKQQ